MHLAGFQNIPQQGLELELAIRRQMLSDPSSQQGFIQGPYPSLSLQHPLGNQNSSGYMKNFDPFQALQTKSPSTFHEPLDQQMNLLLRNDPLLQNSSFQQQNHLYRQQQQQIQQQQQFQFLQQQQQQSQMWVHQQQLYQAQQQRLLLLSTQQEQQYIQQQHQFKQLLSKQQQQLLQLQQQTCHLQSQFQTQVSSSNLINSMPLRTDLSQQFQQQKYPPPLQQSLCKPQQLQYDFFEQYKQGQQIQSLMFQQQLPRQLAAKLSEESLGSQQILQMQKMEEPSEATLLNLNATPKSLYDTDQRQSTQETYLDLGSRQEEIKENILKSAKQILGIKDKEDNFFSYQSLELSKPEIITSQRDQQQSASSIPTLLLAVQNQENQQKQDDNSKTQQQISQQNESEYDVLKKQQEKNTDNSSQEGHIKQQLEQEGEEVAKTQKEEQVELQDDSHGKNKKEKQKQQQQQQFQQKSQKSQKKRREIKPYKIVKLKTLPKEDQLRNYILAQETKNVSKNICLRLSKFASAEKTKFSSISKLREYLLRNIDRDDARNMINYLQYEFLIDIAHQTRNKTKIIYAKYRLKFINGLKDLENFKQLKF